MEIFWQVQRWCTLRLIDALCVFFFFASVDDFLSQLSSVLAEHRFHLCTLFGAEAYAVGFWPKILAHVRFEPANSWVCMDTAAGETTAPFCRGSWCWALVCLLVVEGGAGGCAYILQVKEGLK
ncbi:hypothetical protein QBC32DRAFT_161883 [Pseudoneurospora amorphoporcata]|uniref:Uncharacterized protein n=1 Tax=Pseudoneurospora amorphoporcata TaxID=241081 RepID=A0AAN6NUU6_9PEZI|nr:hypothetical protein QBC32DRAFT_161883 [Pseudoneurospora amorphoporcata]